MKNPLRRQPETPMSLDDRLASIKDEIDGYIDGLAEAEYLRGGRNVPLPVIKAVLMNRSACLCDAFKRVRELEERDAEIAARTSN
jgi:hypothetical protein